MDIKSYIESGILEQFVVGTLSGAEMAEVERLMQTYPEIAAEVSKIETALQLFAQAQGKKPKLTELQLLENLKKTKTKADSSSNWSSYLPWILSALLVLPIWRFYNLSNEAKHEKSQLQIRIDSLSKSCEAQASEFQLLKQKLDLLRNPLAKLVRMQGTALSPSSYASAIMDSTTNKLYFDFAGLPSPPQGKQYQLWVIQGGTPVDMGVIENNLIGKTAIVEKNLVQAAQAFAVTLEDTGGKPSPTLDQMYVLGSL